MPDLWLRKIYTKFLLYYYESYVLFDIEIVLEMYMIQQVINSKLVMIISVACRIDSVHW